MALKLLPEDLSDVPSHLADRYEAQAGRYWDLFYRRNTNKFFKDRHYLHKEFPDLVAGSATLLEVGCGVGNTVFPLLEVNPQLRIHCCDFAASAIELVRQNPLYGSSGGAVHAFVADITRDLLAGARAPGGGCGVPEGGCDLATMVFVLSAIHPQRMAAAVHNVALCLRPGSGRLLFRDYAEGDLAQERLAGADRPKRLGPNFYVRGDGTRCYYFSQAEVLALFASAGFTCDSLTLHERTVVNHKRDIAMDRRWIQAIFTLRHYQPPPQPLELLLAQPPPQHLTHDSYQLQCWQHQQQQQQQQPQEQPCSQTAARSGTGSDPWVIDGPAVDEGGISLELVEGEDAGPSSMDCDGAAGAASGGPAGSSAAMWAPALSAGRGTEAGAAGEEPYPPPPPPQPLPGLMMAGGWLTGAAGRLASHLAAGPGQPSGRALLPDSLDSADDLRAELSSSPNHIADTNPAASTSSLDSRSPHHHHHPSHQPRTSQQQEPQQHQWRSSQPQASDGSSQERATCKRSAGSLQDGAAWPAGHRGSHVGSGGGAGSGALADDMQVDSDAGPGEGPTGRGAVGAAGDVAGRTLESELEAEFFATIGRDSAEVVAEEVTAAGAALSRVRLADLSEVAAARVAAAAPAATGVSPAPDTSLAATAAVPGATAEPVVSAPAAAGHAGCGDGSVAARPQQGPGQGRPRGVVKEVEVPVAQGVSFRCLCGHTLGTPGVPDISPATLSLSRIFLASPRLMAGKCALQLGPARGAACAAAASAATSAPGIAWGAVLPAMAAVRGSARRFVVTEAGREGLAAAAADLRRNAHRLVIERLRLATLDWAAAGTATAAGGTAGAAAASAATGAAGYTYVSGAIRQLRDILHMQPTGYDIVCGADPLAELTSSPVSGAAAGSGARTADAEQVAVIAARGLFDVAAQLVSPGGVTGLGSVPPQSQSPPGRLLLLCFPGAWAAAHGLGFSALAAVCGWELLVPEQLAALYGMDVGAASELGCTAMGFRRRTRA